MKKYLLIVMMVVPVLVAAQTVPAPTAYFDFNTDWSTTENHNANPLDMGTNVPGNTDNGVYAAWYNYNSEFPSLYSGFRDGEGKFNGAAYFAGYKCVCNDDPDYPGDNSPAAARDVLFFAGNASQKAYARNVMDTSALWQGVRTSFTIAYWWRTDRELEGNYTNACPPDEKPDWGEEETQFDGGAFNGIDINCWYNYYKIGWRNGSDGVDDSHQSDYFMPADGNVPGKGDWIHVAVTFDGSTGLLSFYLNGELAVDYDGNTEGNPNPIQTGYTQFDAVTFDEDIVGIARGAVLFGATNGASPSGKNSGGEFWGEVPEYEGKYGYIEDHYRLGWPARGYLDEFAYWKDVALTQDQIKLVMDNEISSIVTGIRNHKVNYGTLKVFPTTSNGNFTVELNNENAGSLSVINMLGVKVYEKNIEKGTASVNISLSVNPGIYLVRFDSDASYNISKIIIR
ncbi:MAG: T9SS type A sorting domain-containing protein [Chlorobi bacterium]|nr:T9SS type A sorting domain-containing protein [Chlorobiota bacterium]